MDRVKTLGISATRYRMSDTANYLAERMSNDETKFPFLGLGTGRTSGVTIYIRVFEG